MKPAVPTCAEPAGSALLNTKGFLRQLSQAAQEQSYSHEHAKSKGMREAPPGATHLAKQGTGGLSTARHSFTDTEQEAWNSCPVLPKVLPFLEEWSLLPSKKVRKQQLDKTRFSPAASASLHMLRHDEELHPQGLQMSSATGQALDGASDKDAPPTGQ